MYGLEHIRINIHFLTHLPHCVLEWGCLWATSTFIPEWFNGELLTLFNGTQFVPDQMAKNHLIKLTVRDEVTSLLAKNRLPKEVASLFRELLHLPDEKHSTGFETNKGAVVVLGKSTSRMATIEEEVALLNLFTKCPMFAHFKNMDFDSTVSFYDRLKLMKCSSVFTTSSYKRSPKRINYCALLNDGSFVEILSIPVIQNRSFIVCQPLGAYSKTVYLPKPIDGVIFRPIPGQTTKLIGKSKVLIAVDPSEILAKCVVSVNSSLTDTIIVTALPNPFETD